MKSMPALFVNHGGGPLPLLGDQAHSELCRHLRQVAGLFPRPLTILVVSAHWETSHLAFVGSDNPGLIYDYSGFPQQSYQISARL
jgi:4,5-DOPA dioxygenase extradiol